MTSSTISRRAALRLVAVTAAGGALMTQRAFAEEASAETTTLMPGADVCVLTPEVTEGPYYFDPAMERADITEGFAGIPTQIKLQVVDGACQPIKGARVDIWHCNAAGVYSGYANQTGGVDTTGQTFLRGTLFADDKGIVAFSTIYPGWYSGRTTHVHFKVFLDETNVLTGQIFFPDALSQYIYENIEPYKTRGADRDTLNKTDSIAQQATRASFAYVKELEEAYLVAMIVGVDPAAESAVGFSGPGGAGGPSGGAGGPPPDGGAIGGGTGAAAGSPDAVELVPGN
jgi:protocatechuate 3,4-dioxygenase beta subunit